jgi:hypothetical protein
MRNMNSGLADDIEKAIDETGLRRTTSNRIEWRKDHDQYPRNWPAYRKGCDTAIIVFFEFYTLSLDHLTEKSCD